MGLLSRRDDDRNILGLPSRYEVPRDVRKIRDTEIGKSIARTQVVEMDMRGIEHATMVASLAIVNVALAAEAAAAQIPYSRHLVDGITNMSAAMMQMKLRELGGAV